MYTGIFRQREYLLRDRAYYLSEIRGRPCPARTAGKYGIPGYQVFANPEAQASGGVARGMKHLNLDLPNLQYITVIYKHLPR